jgi:membrane fusion protein, heavy metal efflux system
MEFDRVITARTLAVTVTLAVLAVGTFAASKSGVFGAAPLADAQPAPKPAPSAGGTPPSPILELSEKQLGVIKIGQVGEQEFPIQKEAIGAIDFNEDLSVQIFTPFQGKIIQAFAQIGDEVKKGQPLFTIDSPDLVQADSTLIAAAATFDLTSRALARAQKLYGTLGTGGIAEKDLDQATSDKLTAEGALKAARDAVRVFGKSEAEINAMIAERKIDPVLVVPSPINGRITARSAQPGLLVQPGNPPAPYAMADISTMWMLANVPEIDSADIKIGQSVKVTTLANPGHVYDGKITTLGATVDPNLHTLLVRSEIKDPDHQLRPGMFANFVIVTGYPVKATALPLSGVVREGDGTMTAWVTTDRHHFAQRTITIGLQRNGFDQILDGLKPGELAVTDGAVFLDAMLTPDTTD